MALHRRRTKQNAIAGDSVRARELFLEAIRNDSTYAPAYYELAANGMYATPDEAVELGPEGFPARHDEQVVITSSTDRRSSTPGVTMRR